MDAKQKESWVAGSTVKAKTDFGDEIEGELFAYDPTLDCVVIQLANESKNFRMLNCSYIKELQVLAPAKETKPLVPLNPTKLKTKEEAALNQARQEASRIGPGVTAEAQAIFNALRKTLPCEWDKDTIVVIDEVRIASPYRTEDCSIPSGGSKASLSRVQKVLENERKRLVINQ